jgi:hypothetical protein
LPDDNITFRLSLEHSHGGDSQRQVLLESLVNQVFQLWIAKRLPPNLVVGAMRDTYYPRVVKVDPLIGDVRDRPRVVGANQAVIVQPVVEFAAPAQQSNQRQGESP